VLVKDVTLSIALSDSLIAQGTSVALPWALVTWSNQLHLAHREALVLELTDFISVQFKIAGK
jgi:hypothetical protein